MALAITTTYRLQLSTKSPAPSPIAPTTTPLSLLDNQVANFAPTAGVWLFSPSPGPAPSSYHLVDTLTKVLSTSYPQWFGRLINSPAGDGRLQLAWGYGPTCAAGVEMVVATAENTKLSDLLPPNNSKNGKSYGYDSGAFPTGKLVPTIVLARGTEQYGIGVEVQPCMAVQITTLHDGLAIGVKMSHAIADASTLVQFMGDWAAMSREETLLTRPFDPSALSKNIPTTPSVELLSKAQQLPFLRYDWYASSTGCPESMVSATKPPLHVEVSQLELGRVMPWDTWDTKAKVLEHTFHFSAREVARLQSVATREGAEMGTVSHLDALVAHVWGAMNRARGLSSISEDVNLCYTFGLRGRLPGITADYIGSPLMLATITMPGSEASALENHGTTAAKIRKTLQTVTAPSALEAVLHELEVSQGPPQRRWNAFLGRNHTIVTSWTKLGAHSIDFGADIGMARGVRAVMPKVDGCVCVIEARAQSGKSWWGDGVEVMVTLEEGAMSRLVRELVGEGVREW